MHMVARRDRVDLAKARVRQPPGEHHVTVEPALPRGDLSKGHAHLKGDACLFGNNGHRPADCNGAPNGFIEHPDGRILSPEVVSDVVAPAGMRLIAVGKAALAARAGPKWVMGFCNHFSNAAGCA